MYKTGPVKSSQFPSNGIDRDCIAIISGIFLSRDLVKRKTQLKFLRGMGGGRGGGAGGDRSRSNKE